MKTLTKQELLANLSIRDLSDPSEGPHAMQILMGNIIQNLQRLWNCESTIYRESPIISVEDNYDKIGISKDNVARNERYTRYVNDSVVLRTMASAMIPRGLQTIKDKLNPDHLLACVGLCYRRDCIDRIHTGEPHQIDLWYTTTDRQLTADDLRKMIDVVVKTVNPDLQYRLEPKIHPYTTGGCQVDVLWNGEWTEILECGLTHPEMLAPLGKQNASGLAMGPGLDRMLQVAKNIPDVRLLRSTDPRISSQMSDLSPYAEVSRMPSVARDMSIVADNDTDHEVLGDQIRYALVENVIESVQILGETYYKDLPPAAVERLGINANQKNMLVRVVLRAMDKTLTTEECNKYRDDIYKIIHQGAKSDLIYS